MKMNTNYQVQLNQIQVQLKWIKSQQASASRNNLHAYVKMFQKDRSQLTQTYNLMIGHSNSVVGLAWSTKQNMGCNHWNFLKKVATTCWHHSQSPLLYTHDEQRTVRWI